MIYDLQFDFVQAFKSVGGRLTKFSIGILYWEVQLPEESFNLFSNVFFTCSLKSVLFFQLSFQPGQQGSNVVGFSTSPTQPPEPFT